MNVPDVLEFVRSAVSAELEIPLESLDDKKSLRGEYGLDSVATVNIVFALESKLDVTIDLEKLVGIDSIETLQALLLSSGGIEGHLPKRS